MKKLLILSIFSLLACQEKVWDPYTREMVSEDEMDPPIAYKVHGLTVRFEDVTGPNKECLWESFKYFQHEMRMIYGFNPGDLHDAADGWHIIFRSEPKECQTEQNGKPITKSCNGYTDNGAGVIMVRIFEEYKFPFYDSAWFHELGHLLHLQVIFQEPDYDHTNIALWNNVARIQQNFIELKQVDCVARNEEANSFN